MPTGKTVEVTVSHPCTTVSVKQGISWSEGIPPHAQQLTYNEKALEDGIALYDYNIQNGSRLELTVLGSKYTCHVSLYTSSNDFMILKPTSNCSDTKREKSLHEDTAIIHYWAHQIYDSRRDWSAY